MISIHLFGKFRMEHQQEVLSVLPSGKPQELLCYLLLRPQHSHPRETLAASLWPDCETRKSKKNLRQALWQLQSALGQGMNRHRSRFLSADSEFVHLTDTSLFQVDVTAFQTAYDTTLGFAGADLDPVKASAIDEGVQLYRGDLLEGCYEDWCLCERERLQNCYLAMLDKLMRYWEKEKSYQRAIDYGERVLRMDHASERTHQRLMRLHYLSGDRTAALRQYERCRAALEKELAVAPSRQTRELYQQICSEQTSSEQAPSGAPAEQPFQILFQLRRVLEVLGQVEVEIRKELQPTKQRPELAARRLAAGSQR